MTGNKYKISLTIWLPDKRKYLRIPLSHLNNMHTVGNAIIDKQNSIVRKHLLDLGHKKTGIKLTPPSFKKHRRANERKA